MRAFFLRPTFGLAVLITFLIPGTIWVLAWKSQGGNDPIASPGSPAPSVTDMNPVGFVDVLATPGPGTWQTSPSGIKYLDLTIGTGSSPMTGQQISVLYSVKVENDKVIAGTRFDMKNNSLELLTYVFGYTPFPAGWTEALSTMKVGGWRRFVLPPGVAYGNTTLGGVVPANSPAMVDVQLVFLDPTILPRDTRR